MANIELNENTIGYHYTNLKGLFGMIGYKKFRLTNFKNTNDIRERHNTSGLCGFCVCMPQDGEETPYAKPRMWAQYGDGDRGVCVAFKMWNIVKRLKDNKIKIDGPFRIEYKSESEIKWADNNSEVGLKYKLNDWKEENECRILMKETEIDISLDDIDKIYIGVDNKNEIELLTKIGINKKLVPLWLLNENVIEENPIPQTSLFTYETGDSFKVNGLGVQPLHFSQKEDVEDKIATINAIKFYEELQSLNGYALIPAKRIRLEANK